VPIYTNERWAGLLALGPKVSGDRYFDEDLAFLQTIADQTAVALENARLYDNLKQRNTENERLNVRLTAANQELARLDKAKSDFINIASHELRTPLTQVKGFNDLLSEMVKSHAVELDSAEQMTDAVSRATQRLEDIVETMFDVSKVDTNTLDLECAPVSLASILTAAVETWRKGLQERAQSISVEGISGLPQVCADGRRLTQVFANLIQNAIKFTPDRGQISVSGRVTCPTDPAEQFVEITVADTGIGIAAEDLERIFEKFYRVGNVLLHSTGDTKFKGSGPGLGLTIARGIVEAHGGRIRAESPGHDEEKCPGARFIVLLPVSQD
jgi:signal transduction histidine kinase